MRSHKSLASRVVGLEQARGTGRVVCLWDDHDGKLELQITVMKESGEIQDGDVVHIYSCLRDEDGRSASQTGIFSEVAR